jgi:tetratricopeptide (TPR) repeat protein
MSSHLLILGRSAVPSDRIPSDHASVRLDARTLPFMRMDAIALPPAPRTVVIESIDRAFPDAQKGGTRLVLTQSTYLLQKWIDRLDEGDRIVATADREALERCAPEAFQGRGCWSAFETVEGAGNWGLGASYGDDHATSASPQSLVPSPFAIAAQLASAFRASDPQDRLRLCREAAALDPDCEVAQLALASACRENRDGAGARAALDRAAALAPDWEAVAFESGKLSLVYDDLTRARDAFQRAADLMPSFSAANSNLGAALGELGDPASALRAFRQALAFDPRGFTILNNIGVVSRELGRLEESAAAFREVIAINPGFVFGHYNLGQTLFLLERYTEALAAYEEGQRRDPQQNRRQGCRLAVARFATGDVEGAGRDLWRCADAAPPDERGDLLLEAYEIVRALLTRHPASAPQQAFLDQLGAEIIKSE